MSSDGFSEPTILTRMVFCRALLSRHSCYYFCLVYVGALVHAYVCVSVNPYVSGFVQPLTSLHLCLDFKQFGTVVLLDE